MPKTSAARTSRSRSSSGAAPRQRSPQVRPRDYTPSRAADPRTLAPVTSTPAPERGGAKPRVSGPLAWVPELLAIGFLVALVAVLVGVLL